MTSEVKNVLLEKKPVKSAAVQVRKKGSVRRRPSQGTRHKSKILPVDTPYPVKIYFLGGLNEIGKNITLYECCGDMIIVDCGMAFPESDMLGVDLVIPDFTFIEKNRDKIRGIFLTHGHEDQIGALPYL